MSVKSIPSNTVVRWAVAPHDLGRLDYIEDMHDETNTIPYENQVITRKFLVDPVTRLPVPVIVLQLQHHPQMNPYTIAIVVTLAHAASQH